MMGGAAVQVLQPTVCSDAHQKKIVGRRKVCVWGVAKGRARSQSGYCSDLTAASSRSPHEESPLASHGLGNTVLLIYSGSSCVDNVQEEQEQSSGG